MYNTEKHLVYWNCISTGFNGRSIRQPLCEYFVHFVNIYQTTSVKQLFVCDVCMFISPVTFVTFLTLLQLCVVVLWGGECVYAQKQRTFALSVGPPFVVYRLKHLLGTSLRPFITLLQSRLFSYAPHQSNVLPSDHMYESNSISAFFDRNMTST